MSNVYLGFHFTIAPKEPATEILIAELAELPFESFVENDNGVSAYIQKDQYLEGSLAEVYILQSPEFTIHYTVEEIDQVNWNEEWEKNFDPIDVDGICHVRAPFHEKTAAQFDIVIEPKMSFGTGHHETTHMMIQHLLGMNVQGMKALDMGCGTALLAILAELKGAQPIDAIDIDNWCYLNSIENAERNGCQHITVEEGDANLLPGRSYDLIIANINRNILLNDMQTYVDCLRPKGTLLLSGFYIDDIPYLDAACTEKGLEFVNKLDRNNWASLHYVKKG
jgi:ribosomal protein L11 methyltransferase